MIPSRFAASLVSVFTRLSICPALDNGLIFTNLRYLILFPAVKMFLLSNKMALLSQSC